MSQIHFKIFARLLHLVFSLVLGVAAAVVLLFVARGISQQALAAPIPPPQGYPKFTESTMTVTPSLAYTGGAVLEFTIEIVNTGAWAGENTSLTNILPANTVYSSSESSVPPQPVFANGVLTWNGNVGFDDKVVIRLNVVVSPTYEGIISNTAVIDHDLIASPVTVTASAMITNKPVLEIQKSSEPAIPGPNKPITYTLTVVNLGQPTVSLPITVTDEVPLNTTLLSVGQGGIVGPNNDIVTWTQPVTLLNGEAVVFTFSVQVNNVVSGTVIRNDAYQVSNPTSGTDFGAPYTVTVVDPVLFIHKTAFPDPPGANREMTYTLVVLNKGSLATDLTVSDVLPDGITYVRGGTLVGDTVEWHLPRLESGEAAYFTFTVAIGDEAAFVILNGDYRVCSAEDVCSSGEPLTSAVWGPVFEAWGWLDPIAKKPGGGNTPITPTLVVHNLGPGNALDATALLYFYRISVQASDLIAIPPVGQFFPGADCGDQCVSYRWVGNIGYSEMITFTTLEGQNSRGGEEGTLYTATLVITDDLGGYITDPITATATGKVTHLANLVPTKTAPPVIGAGMEMTYTIQVFNSGQTTEEPPLPYLTETLPASLTLVRVNDGGVWYQVGDKTVISWTLPAMGPGEMYFRSFVVEVPAVMVSGTEIVNDRYQVFWLDTVVSGMITGTYILSNTGEPVTTVVREVGLIDSYKTVTPTLLWPGAGHVLTYVVHVVNSGPKDLHNVVVYDDLPWEYTTYQRDAVASSGQIISDIVSISWIGDVAAFSEERITFTVIVDSMFEGVITNTAIITHESIDGDVIRYAVTYVTNDPVLRIGKTAKPSPVQIGNELLYAIQVTNLGQQATHLVVTDTIPLNTVYVPGSATGGGALVGNQITWEWLVLRPGERQTLTFRVAVLGGREVINGDYAVRCAEGVSARGAPLITPIYLPFGYTYLPTIMK